MCKESKFVMLFQSAIIIFIISAMLFGCAGSKELADADSAAGKNRTPAGSVLGTEWIIKYSNTDGELSYLLVFKPDGILYNEHPNDTTHDNDFWEQKGNRIKFNMNNSYVVYEGVIENGTMNGSARNIKGLTWEWEAARIK